MRRRLIETTGTRVATISAAEWEARPDASERRALLESILQPFQEGFFWPALDAWRQDRWGYIQKNKQPISEDAGRTDGNEEDRGEEDGSEEERAARERRGPVMLTLEGTQPEGDEAPAPAPGQKAKSGGLRTARWGSLA